MVDIAELKELAEKATKGPWVPLQMGDAIEWEVVSPDDDYPDPWNIAEICDGAREVPASINAAYIAAANPSAVLELISEITRLRAREAKLVEGLQVFAKQADRVADDVDGAEWVYQIVYKSPCPALLLSDMRAARSLIQEDGE